MEIEKVIDAIGRSQSCLILTHMNPEGDALGSSLGLALALKQMNKEVCIYNVDSVPRVLHFLPHEGLYQQKKKIDRDFDTMFVLDCGDAHRTGLMDEGAFLPPVIINIDHHISNNLFGTLNWIDPDATATAEMIYDLLLRLDISLTPEIALSLYTALFTETGSFRYSNTTPKTLRVSAALMEKGVEPYRLSRELYERRSLGGLKLLGEVLTRMEQSEDGKIGSVVVTQDLLNLTQTDLEDVEDFIDYPRSLDGVEISVFFRELGFDRYKISFRSRNHVDVSKLAGEFGGGGHRYAAGCQVLGNLDHVKKRVMDAVVRSLS